MYQLEFLFNQRNLAAKARNDRQERRWKPGKRPSWSKEKMTWQSSEKEKDEAEMDLVELMRL